MIKGRITQVDHSPPETHHVQSAFGTSQEIVTRRGRTIITFDVTELEGDARGIDFMNTDWVLVPVGGAVSGVVSAVMPDVPIPIVYGGKEAGTW